MITATHTTYIHAKLLIHYVNFSQIQNHDRMCLKSRTGENYTDLLRKKIMENKTV